MEVVKPDFTGLLLLFMLAIIPVAAILLLIFGFVFKKKGLKLAGFIVLALLVIGIVWILGPLFF